MLSSRADELPLIVTTSTAGYHHWLDHLHLNLKLLGLQRLLRVCAADDATVAHATSLGIGVVNATTASTNAADYGLQTATAASTFMSTAWRAAVHYKQHCVWSMLERSAPGAHLLLVDGDVTFFKDPLRALRMLRARNASAPDDDVLLMDDTTPRAETPYLNSGFMLLRNSPATRAFGRSYLNQLQRRRAENDQNVFNDVLRAMSVTGPFASAASSGGRPSPVGGHQAGSVTALAKMAGGAKSLGGKANGGASVANALRSTVRHNARHPGLRVRVLDSRSYPCGYFFYEYRHRRPLNASALVAVHHNWCAMA